MLRRLRGGQNIEMKFHCCDNISFFIMTKEISECFHLKQFFDLGDNWFQFFPQHGLEPSSRWIQKTYGKSPNMRKKSVLKKKIVYFQRIILQFVKIVRIFIRGEEFLIVILCWTIRSINNWLLCEHSNLVANDHLPELENLFELSGEVPRLRFPNRAIAFTKIAILP